VTEPIQVIPMGEPELPPETVTERALEEIIQGSRVIHARHQGFTKAMARKLLAAERKVERLSAPVSDEEWITAIQSTFTARSFADRLIAARKDANNDKEKP
jgi:hypothetical protein